MVRLGRGGGFAGSLWPKITVFQKLRCSHQLPSPLVPSAGGKQDILGIKALCHYLLTDHKVNCEVKWLAGWAKGELAPSYSCVRALFNSRNVEFGLQHPDLVVETHYLFIMLRSNQKSWGLFHGTNYPVAGFFFSFFEKLHNLPP